MLKTIHAPTIAAIIVSFLLSGVALRASEEQERLHDTELAGLAGSWEVVNCHSAGLESPWPVEHIAFGLERCFGIATTMPVTMRFSIDTEHVPHRISFQFPTSDAHSIPAIYELNGDELRVCVSYGGEYPTTFAAVPGNRQNLLVLRRAKTLAPSGVEKNELDAFVNELIALLEANRYDEFVERINPADHWSRVDRRHSPDWVEYSRKAAPRIIAHLRALLDRVPTMSAAGDEATYEVRVVPISDAFIRYNTIFVNVNGRWYVRESEAIPGKQRIC